MKKILFSIPYGMSARNFMRSDAYRVLREKVHLVVASPLAEDPVFCEEFAHPHVQFVSLPRVRHLPLRLIMQALFSIETTLFTDRNPTVSTLVTLRDQLRRENPPRYFLYRSLTSTVGRIPGFLDLLRRLYFGSLKNPAVDRLFSENNFDLVFLTHGYIQDETELALVANSKKIPVVNMIHSWDNVTSKSAMRQMVSPNVGRVWRRELTDWAVVWNEILASELGELYGFPRERVSIVGIPQFDDYVKKSLFLDRNEFFKLVKGDPGKKTILYMAAAPSLFHDQTVIIQDLIDAIKSKRITQPTQLLVRFHPRSDMSSWMKRFEGTGVLFHTPDAASSALPVHKGWNRSDLSASELANQIFHSDVVLNGFSTTSIDAAAFDKPVVCYGYDGDVGNLPMVEKLYKGVTHYEKLMALGGVRVGRNRDELIAHINDYLNNPTLDAEGRSKIREKECYRVDGKSGQRIAEFLLSVLERSR